MLPASVMAVGEVLNCCCLGVGQYVIQAQYRLSPLLMYSAHCQWLSSLGEYRVLLLLGKKKKK